LSKVEYMEVVPKNWGWTQLSTEKNSKIALISQDMPFYKILKRISCRSLVTSKEWNKVNQVSYNKVPAYLYHSNENQPVRWGHSRILTPTAQITTWKIEALK
jgi:hypothetical protein